MEKKDASLSRRVQVIYCMKRIYNSWTVMINERARSLARKPRKKKVELQGTTASWSSVGVISCTRLLCIVLCWVEWRNWPVVLLMMIMMMMIKVLRWSLLLQQCDQPAAACVVIICVSEVSASVWHTLQRPISCLRDKGGKGREVGKGRREGKKGREEKGGIFRFVVSRQPCPPIHAVPTADDTCVVAGCTFIHPCFLFFILHTSSSFHGESWPEFLFSSFSFREFGGIQPKKRKKKEQN